MLRTQGLIQNCCPCTSDMRTVPFLSQTHKCACRVVQDQRMESRMRSGRWNYEKLLPFFVTCVWHTPVIFWKKKTKELVKKCIVTLLGVRIRLGLFFEVSTLLLNAVDHPFDPFLVDGLLEFGFWNAIKESVDCIHHCVVRTELTTPQRLLESRKLPEIARVQIRTIRGGWLHYVDLLAGQPNIHNFWRHVVECYRGAKSIDAPTLASSFGYVACCNCCNTPQ